MSFILEALKKSEQKRRDEESQSPPSIHERDVSRIVKTKRWMFAVLVLVAITASALFWYVVVRPSPVLSDSELILTPDVPRSQVASPLPVPVDPPPRAVKAQLPPPSFVQSKPRSKPQLAVTTQSPVKHQQQVAPRLESSVPILRNESKIYDFDQLPGSIRNSIPTLKMMLHAYNREDSSASMVQLNGQILREGDSVTAQIKLQQITAEGIVLRYDGYRFLVLRRMN